MTRTHFVARSGNSKTGPVAATYRERTSCPTSCPMLDKGCYAAGRIESAARKGTDDAGVWVDRAIRETPAGSLLRHNVVGDVLADGQLDTAYTDGVERVARERPDIAQYGYTHAWRDPAVAEWMRTGAAVFAASCETREQVTEASRAGLIPVVILTGPDDPLIGDTVDGRRVVQCPEQTREGVTCASCRLCARADTDGWRRPVIGFAAHGAAKRSAAAYTGRGA